MLRRQLYKTHFGNLVVNLLEFEICNEGIWIYYELRSHQLLEKLCMIKLILENYGFDRMAVLQHNARYGQLQLKSHGQLKRAKDL